MITYEEAKKKATQTMKGLKTAWEYKDAYVFTKGDDEEDDSEIVILKRNGNAISMSDYIAVSVDDGDPKRIKF